MADKYQGIEAFIFSDSFILFTKYHNMIGTDEQWENCINDANMLYKKYSGHPLARTIISATINQIEHKVNKTKLDGYSYEQWNEIIGLKDR